MKAARISELKKELAKLNHDDLLDVCVRLAKFKVESKELLTYLLMKADDEIGYADELCDEIDVNGGGYDSYLPDIERFLGHCLQRGD